MKKHPVKFKSICEVGCGSGEILVQLQKRFSSEYSWIGYDISSDAMAIAERKANEHLKFELKDIAKVPESIQYDLMLVIDVIEHLENYFNFLDTILVKSKYFIFHIPLDISIWSIMREGILIESKNRVGHIHNFTEAFIISILKDHGFNILTQSYTEPVNKVDSFKQKIVNLIRTSLYIINPWFCTKVMGGYSIMVLAEKKE